MRQAAVVGITLAVILVFGQALALTTGADFTPRAVAAVQANGVNAPSLQTTATATAPGDLPNTGASDNYGLMLLGGVALIFVGAATVLVIASRRPARRL